MTLLGFFGKLTAVGIVLVAIAIGLIPNFLYESLPEGISLDLTQPTTIVVTGANSGLGLATVYNFAHNENATIIMACRSLRRCEAAKQQTIESQHNNAKAILRPMQMDLSDRTSMEAFARQLQNQPIDILIHNAGVAGSTKELEFHPEDGVETHVRVNHLGPVYLTHCLWNNLLLSQQPRIVLVSSLTAFPQKPGPTFGWYAHEERFQKSWNIKMYGGSKRANLFFAQELHQRYSPKITVTAAHPGWTHTDLCQNGCQGQGKLTRYFANLNFYTGILKMAPQVGALSQCYAAVIPRGGVYLGPSLGIVGDPKLIGALNGSWHHSSFSREESLQLWDKSMKALGIAAFGEMELPVDRNSHVEEEPIGQEELSSENDDSEPIRIDAQDNQ